jgi:Mg2+/Co2+ transporter CorB
LGTLAVTFHLALSGTEAILLANAWVLMVVFTAVLRKTWPLFLGGYLPYKNAPLWAIIMIILWFLAIFFMVFLAWTRQKLQTMGWNERQAYLSLVALTWVALATGWMVFQLSFP